LEEQQHACPQFDIEDPVAAKKPRMNTIAKENENNFRIKMIAVIAKWSLPINPTGIVWYIKLFCLSTEILQ
jgi:hypothetical protein